MMPDPFLKGSIEHQRTRMPLAHKIAIVGFFLVLIDVLLNYFIVQALGHTLQVNALVAVAVGLLFLNDPHRLLPSNSLCTLLVVWMVISIYGFYSGDYHVSAHYSPAPLPLILGTINSVAMLMLGYYCFKWLHPTALIKVILLAGLAHALINIIAISGLNPAWFPVKTHLTQLTVGEFTVRKHITSDPNFQVIYFLPTAAILALPFGRFRTPIALFATAVAALTLAEVQSRSGTLVLGGCLALVWLAPLRMKELGRFKVVFLSWVVALAAIYYQNEIIDVTSGIVGRFTSKATQGTASFRLESFLYFIDNFWKPKFYLPLGPGYFGKDINHHILPHSNITSMMMRGGLAGVITWFVVTIFPIVRLSFRFLKKQIDSIGVVVLIICISLLAIQLSLDCAAMKHLWIWAGAAMGVLTRLNLQEMAQRLATPFAFPCGTQTGTLGTTRSHEANSWILPESPY
jgi:hypothetical protein